MVISHDLCQDLGVSPEELKKRRTEDAKLDHWLVEYENVDQRTVNAEEANPVLVSDEELRAMKEERLVIKDKIMQQLQGSAAGD